MHACRKCWSYLRPIRRSPTKRRITVRRWMLFLKNVRRCLQGSDLARSEQHKGNIMSEKILSRKEGTIGHLIFNNPEKLNAISLEMWEGMGRVVEEFERDPEVRVIVLYGAGGKSFVSGADVSKYEEERMGENAQEHYAKTGE